MPGSWLDPILLDLHPEMQSEELRRVNADSPPWEGTLQQFLSHDTLVRGDEKVTIRELIKHYANREGGVHYDAAPPEKELLAHLRAESESALRLTVLAAGRIIYRGLEPLAAAVMLAERPGPFGLRTDSEAVTPYVAETQPRSRSTPSAG
ncbi:hypothetical protein ACFQX8_05870 [Klenkia terrae]|uniref:hypothetical protein n=1 Tax=Klenkia terrae TaxID=1052259 RepID=UPI00361190EC